jgi:hypothetical protein
VIADLDTVRIALYAELTDRIIPSSRPRFQVLLRYDDERHWLRAAPSRPGTCFPGCLGGYNEREGSGSADGGRTALAG